MKDFTMTARTTDGDWYTFEMKDVPCYVDDNHLALLRKPDSPLLQSDLLRRGFDGFFEGDILQDDKGCLWLVCYERGFYAIDKNYRVVYLDKCKEWKKVGDCFGIEFPVKCSFRTKHLFKTNGTTYRIKYIYGVHGDFVLIRTLHNLVHASAIKQECCIFRDGVRLFLGDEVEGKPIQLHNGRVVIEAPGGQYKDIATGGIIC